MGVVSVVIVLVDVAGETFCIDVYFGIVVPLLGDVGLVGIGSWVLIARSACFCGMGARGAECSPCAAPPMGFQV